MPLRRQHANILDATGLIVVSATLIRCRLMAGTRAPAPNSFAVLRSISVCVLPFYLSVCVCVCVLFNAKFLLCFSKAQPSSSLAKPTSTKPSNIVVLAPRLLLRRLTAAAPSRSLLLLFPQTQMGVLHPALRGLFRTSKRSKGIR